MKQRLKYACAILHGPQVLILDEPTANLDVEGKAIARAVFEEQRQRGIAIVATNEPQELAWSTSVINLDMRGQNE
jgi:heme exporter protein A